MLRSDTTICCYINLIIVLVFKFFNLQLLRFKPFERKFEAITSESLSSQTGPNNIKVLVLGLDRRGREDY